MEYKETVSMVIKKYGAFVFFVFFVSFLLGVFFVQAYPEKAEIAFRELTQGFAPVLALGPVEMLFFIFLNNTVKIFLGMVLGILFAVPTVLFLLVNGLALGFVSAVVYPEMGLLNLTLTLLPHGIPELLALFIGSSFGIWLGVSFWDELKTALKKKNIQLLFKEGNAKHSLRVCWQVFLCFIIPLLVLAAIIETLLIFL